MDFAWAGSGLKSNFDLSAFGGSKITQDFDHNKSDTRASPLNCTLGAELRPPEQAAHGWK